VGFVVPVDILGEEALNLAEQGLYGIDNGLVSGARG